MYPEENNPAAGASLLQQLHIAMIRLDGKADTQNTSLKELKTVIEKRFEDHEARIRLMESRPYVAPATVWKVVGFLVTVIALVVSVIGIILR